MSMDKEIIISDFVGLVPGFWKNANPSYGNSGHASDTQHIDLTDPSVLTQGPGLADLTAGTQAGAITTLLKGIMKESPDGTNIYATGGNLLHKITSGAVINDIGSGGDWPHTINKAVVTGELGEDVLEYGGYIWYSYNHSGGAGDIGRYDQSTTFDDDYMSTVPTDGAALQGGVPHPMAKGGLNKLYIGNGRYVAEYSASTGIFVAQSLNLPSGEVVSGLIHDHNRLYVFANKPNLTSSTYMTGSIYVWDMTSTSWEYQITVPGKTGGAFDKNGVVYFFYQDVSATAQFKFAYIEGNQTKDVVSFSGSLPGFHQVIDDDNHIIWLAGGEVWAWGAPSNNLPVKFFQYADAGHDTSGGITNAFGTPMMASFDSSGGTAYRLAQFSGYDVNAQWKSILFDISSTMKTAFVDRIMVQTEPLSTGAACDMTITYDYGSSTETATTVQIAYDSADTLKTRWVVTRSGVSVENFRIDLSWANGSATNPVKIRKIMIGLRLATNK